MNDAKKLLLANRLWAEEIQQRDPEFFASLCKEQKPQFLWLGCSDSRVPVGDITGTEPGEIFVHRNIANLVVHTDLNMLSVLSFAVEHLKVEHIIVCGHYGCGGVKAAMSSQSFGLLNQWLRHIKDVYRHHKDEVHLFGGPEKRLDRLVEINVLEQVQNLARTSIIQRAWRLHQRPTLHGWVYAMNDGLLKELVTVSCETQLDEIYAFDFRDEILQEGMHRNSHECEHHDHTGS